uniref:Uncharacterized protein n=1 Tax=Manihot esculenta TaxID=3983 RepID=A0A2C9U211_MANES
MRWRRESRYIIVQCYVINKRSDDHSRSRVATQGQMKVEQVEMTIPKVRQIE